MPAADPSRFFLRLSRAAAVEDVVCHEDFLTECLAAALAEDDALARSFLELLTGSRLANIAGDCVPIRIETQVNHPGSCLDVVFRFEGTAPVAVEIKLDAPEGDGQLAKYLALPEGYRVAFLTPDRRTIAPEVLAHPRYLRPADGRENFTWYDVYPIAAGATTSLPIRTTVRRALVGLLDELGFSPAIPELGDLHSEDERERAQNRQNAGKLLQRTKAALEELGWALQGGDQPGDVWTRRGQIGRLSRVWVGTFVLRGQLKIRLYFPSEADRTAAETDLRTAMAACADESIGQATVISVRKIVDQDSRVVCATDVLVPHRVLERLSSADAMSACWAGTVKAVVACAAGQSAT